MRVMYKSGCKTSEITRLGGGGTAQDAVTMRVKN